MIEDSPEQRGVREARKAPKARGALGELWNCEEFRGVAEDRRAFVSTRSIRIILSSEERSEYHERRDVPGVLGASGAS